MRPGRHYFCPVERVNNGRSIRILGKYKDRKRKAEFDALETPRFVEGREGCEIVGEQNDVEYEQ